MNIIVLLNVVVAAAQAVNLSYEAYARIKGIKRGKALVTLKSGEEIIADFVQIGNGDIQLSTEKGMVSVKQATPLKDGGRVVKAIDSLFVGATSALSAFKISKQ
jgi:hypothetical protein